MEDQNLNQQQPDNFEPQIPSPGQQFQPVTSDPIHHPKKSKKKVILFFLIVLLLTGGTAAAYYFFFKKDSAPAPAAETPAPAQQAQTPTGPNTLVYASKVSENKYTLKWNNIDSDTPNTATGNITAEYPGISDVNKSNVAFISQKALYLSTDAGKSYKKIEDISDSKFITSLKFSNSGTKLAYNMYNESQSNNVVSSVISVDVNNPTNKTELFKSQKNSSGFVPAVYIEGWEVGSLNKMVYAEGCTQCDGPRTGYYVGDLVKNKSTQLLKDVDNIAIDNISASQDFSKIIFTQATIDKKISTDDLTGYYVGAPYTISIINLSDNKITKVGTAGVKGTKKSDGTYAYTQIYAGFLANSTTPYYAYAKDLYIAQSEKPSVAFTSSKNIQSVLYVNNDVLIGASGDSATDFTTFNYNFGTKKLVSLVQSTKDSISLFGVTSND